MMSCGACPVTAMNTNLSTHHLPWHYGAQLGLDKEVGAAQQTD